ncbi:MAG: AAA family ATPase [Candidatus Hydrogenedentes bacterium]|nr:AAA family ATPase [Candidatus Hydrogenedentota bacterium]
MRNYQVFDKGDIVKGKYTVRFLIKKKEGVECYRVNDKKGKVLFLKLYYLPEISPSDIDEDGNPMEINILRNVNHKNIVRYIESDEISCDNSSCKYLVLDFVPGEDLSEKRNREKLITPGEVSHIVSSILAGLDYLHSLTPPIVHNNLTLDNILLDLTNNPPHVVIGGFSRARLMKNGGVCLSSENLDTLELFYLAPECFEGKFSTRSDLYSVGALMYHLLFGIPPWFVKDVQSIKPPFGKLLNLRDKILSEREKPLKYPNVKGLCYPPDVIKLYTGVITKALSQDPEERFSNAKEFLDALKGKLSIRKSRSVTSRSRKGETSPLKKKVGFNAISGMDTLKEKLKEEVIDPIRNPEEYLKHNLTIPNGVLFYGPPGCGKTFFAEKFAEEAGFNYIKVKCSDIASIYIHGTQEKIREVFEEAKKQAPTILFFDELDAMVPDRDLIDNASQRGEVNEFLAQLDNIGSSGVFVIGATNRPEVIDRAILRSGRLEKWYYIPPPDYNARIGLFKLYISERPHSSDINIEKLSEITENYVASDIKLIVDESSKLAIKKFRNGEREDSMIIMEDLIEVIKKQKPTVPPSELKRYEEIRKKFEEDSYNVQRPRIGFKVEEKKEKKNE